MGASVFGVDHFLERTGLTEETYSDAAGRGAVMRLGKWPMNNITVKLGNYGVNVNVNGDKDGNEVTGAQIRAAIG